MKYESWRATYQSSEQAARSAFNQITEMAKEIESLKQFKRIIFKPDDESTYPPSFQWVKTNIGIGYHAFLSDVPDETYDNWHFIFDNKDEPTLSIGLGTDNEEIEVEWWVPIYKEYNHEPKRGKG